MAFTTIAQNELNNLKKSVIGICKHDDLFYMVVAFYENTPCTMDWFRVTQFGVIQQCYGMPLRGHYQAFPNNQSMIELLEKPHEWAKFIDSFL